jgi:hypothetical protein
MPHKHSLLHMHTPASVTKSGRGKSKKSIKTKQRPLAAVVLPAAHAPHKVFVVPAHSPLASSASVRVNSTPPMFGYPSAPDLSLCVPVPLAARDPPLGADDEASLRYWRARAEFVAQKTEYFERKCGELAAQLGFATHALNDHARKSLAERVAMDDRQSQVLSENARLTSLLAVAFAHQKDYDSLLEDKRLMQGVMDSMTETLENCMREPLPGFEHSLMCLYPCDGCSF